jgi:glycosyltransferase involved in cell wall biosynthesis
VVASPVGVQAEQVRPGETGFLGATSVELAQALARLVEEPDLRARMGAAAREDARRRWSRETWAPRLLAHLEGWLA